MNTLRISDSDFTGCDLTLGNNGYNIEIANTKFTPGHLLKGIKITAIDNSRISQSTYEKLMGMCDIIMLLTKLDIELCNFNVDGLI